MPFQVIYERSVNVLASTLAMVAQRLPFLKSLTPIFGAPAGISMAAPLTVTFVGTHSLSGQSLTIQPTGGSSDTETVGVGEQFVWSFKLSDPEHEIEEFGTVTNGVLEALPEGLSFSGPTSDIYFLAGIPTVPGQYTISITGYRRANRIGDKTLPYVLNLTVEGGANPPTPFEEFIATFWSGEDLENPELVAPTADPDGDGIDNALEFVLDLDPTKPDAMPGTMGVDPNDPTLFRYEIPLNALAAATAVSFEESPNLDDDWTDVAVENFTRTDESIILSVPLATKKFYRLKVILE